MNLILDNISEISKYLFFLCLITIIVVSVIPGVNVESYEVSEGFSFRLDYLLHFLAFFALSTFFLVWRRRKGITAVLITVFIGTFLGFILEFQQIYIIGRTFNPVDAYLNIAGAMVGLVVAVVVLIRQDKMDLIK